MREYILRISLEKDINLTKLNEIIGLNGIIDEGGDWAFSFNDKDDNKKNVNFIELFYSKLIGKFKKLKEIGINRDSITIWYLYEYQQQCNLEFDSDDFKKLNHLGLTLCISCWQE